MSATARACASRRGVRAQRIAPVGSDRPRRGARGAVILRAAAQLPGRCDSRRVADSGERLVPMSAKPRRIHPTSETDPRRSSAAPNHAYASPRRTSSAMKQTRRKIVMITAYDALFASLLDQAGVDVILVGDSVGPVLAGKRRRFPSRLGQMVYHGRSVQRGASPGARRRGLAIRELPGLAARRPFGTRAAMLKRTGAAAVKLGGRTRLGGDGPRARRGRRCR